MIVDPITVDVRGQRISCSRDQLATAMLLLLDYPTDPRAVREALKDEHGVEHYQALRLTLLARYCIDNGIEP